MYEKEFKPIEAVNSEVEAVNSEVEALIATLSTQIRVLKSSFDVLESRLHPVLPEAQLKNPKTEERGGIDQHSGNLCPVSRSIEMQVYKVSDIIEQVEVILKELRI